MSSTVSVQFFLTSIIKDRLLEKALTPFPPSNNHCWTERLLLIRNPNSTLIISLWLASSSPPKTMDSDEINTQSAFRQKSPRAKHNRHVSFEVPARQRKDSTSEMAEAKDSDDDEFIDPREAKPSAVCHTLRHCNTDPLN